MQQTSETKCNARNTTQRKKDKPNPEAARPHRKASAERKNETNKDPYRHAGSAAYPKGLRLQQRRREEREPVAHTGDLQHKLTRKELEEQAHLEGLLLQQQIDNSCEGDV